MPAAPRRPTIANGRGGGREPARRRGNDQQHQRADDDQRERVGDALRQRRGEHVRVVECAARADHERANELAGARGKEVVAEESGRGRPERGRHADAPSAFSRMRQRQARRKSVAVAIAGGQRQQPGIGAATIRADLAPLDAAKRVVQQHGRQQAAATAERRPSGPAAAPSVIRRTARTCAARRADVRRTALVPAPLTGRERSAPARFASSGTLDQPATEEERDVVPAGLLRLPIASDHQHGRRLAGDLGAQLLARAGADAIGR